MTHGTLYYGDNLQVLRDYVATESVDLIYLDPPFNSNRSYNVLFGGKHGDDAAAQIEAFDDTWTWTHETEELFMELQAGGAPSKVADALRAMRELVGDGEVLAYLVMMAVRLVELHRVLTPTGSLYLHCDPTASHYLKVLMDAIFGPKQFRNEIVWSYKRWTASKKRLPRLHDVILFYTKTSDYFFECPTRTNDDPNPSQYVSAKDESGKTVVARDEDGNPIKRDLSDRIQVGDVWEMPLLSPVSKERLGYPTQKPQAVLERIIEESSRPGDLVLDPFCGCGTTVAAAQALGRDWIGIDITFIAVDLVRRRLEDTYGDDLTFDIRGIPSDIAGARALFAASHLDFERWAVSRVHGQPNQKQVGDKGVDGWIRFPLDTKSGIGRCAVSVKGGGQLGPAMVRDLIGTMESQKADMGVLITMGEPTRGMVDAANHGGTYTWPVNGQTFPRIQLVTVEQLLRGEEPDMPPTLTPYLQAKRRAKPAAEQMELGSGG